MVFFVVGAIYLHEIVSKGVNQMSSGPLAFFNETKDEMTVLMTDHNYDPPKVTVNFDEFNDLFDTITTEVSSVKDFMNKTIIPTIAVGASLGALVFILVVAAMIVTRCYCCLWCGGMCGWVYYLLAVIYSIFAFALAIGFYAVATVCGEIRLQYKRYPGIFQWYFVPRIEEEVDFKTLRKDIANETAQSSMDACADLFNICEASTGVNDDKPFVCPDGFTSSDQCLNYYDVSDVVDNTVMKPSLIPTLCPAPGGSSSGWTCTIEECSTSCNDESVKDTAMKVISTMDFAANATEALALADPLIQTDYIVDLVLSVIESKANSPLAGYHHGNVYRCTELRLISLMFAVSFFIGALILLVALCVLLSAYQAYKAAPKEEKDSKEDKKKKKDLPPTLTAEDDVDMDSLNEPKDLYSRSEDSEGMNERALALGEEQPGEPLSLGADHYGIPAEFYQDDAVDEEEMLNRARQTSNRRLPLNPLAR